MENDEDIQQYLDGLSFQQIRSIEEEILSIKEDSLKEFYLSSLYKHLPEIHILNYIQEIDIDRLQFFLQQLPDKQLLEVSLFPTSRQKRLKIEKEIKSRKIKISTNELQEKKEELIQKIREKIEENNDYISLIINKDLVIEILSEIGLRYLLEKSNDDLQIILSFYKKREIKVSIPYIVKRGLEKNIPPDQLLDKLLKNDISTEKVLEGFINGINLYIENCRFGDKTNVFEKLLKEIYSFIKNDDSLKDEFFYSLIEYGKISYSFIKPIIRTFGKHYFLEHVVDERFRVEPYAEPGKNKSFWRELELRDKKLLKEILNLMGERQTHYRHPLINILRREINYKSFPISFNECPFLLVIMFMGKERYWNLEAIKFNKKSFKKFLRLLLSYPYFFSYKEEKLSILDLVILSSSSQPFWKDLEEILDILDEYEMPYPNLLLKVVIENKYFSPDRRKILINRIINKIEPYSSSYTMNKYLYPYNLFADEISYLSPENLSSFIETNNYKNKKTIYAITASLIIYSKHTGNKLPKNLPPFITGYLLLFLQNSNLSSFEKAVKDLEIDKEKAIKIIEEMLHHKMYDFYEYNGGYAEFFNKMFDYFNIDPYSLPPMKAYGLLQLLHDTDSKTIRTLISELHPQNHIPLIEKMPAYYFSDFWHKWMIDNRKNKNIIGKVVDLLTEIIKQEKTNILVKIIHDLYTYTNFTKEIYVLLHDDLKEKLLLTLWEEDKDIALYLMETEDLSDVYVIAKIFEKQEDAYYYLKKFPDVKAITIASMIGIDVAKILESS